MRDNVVGQVGECGHHTAADSTAENLHVTGLSPLISCSVIVLDAMGGVVVDVAPDNKELVFEHFDAKVAAGSDHGGHVVPGVGVGVVGLSTAQTCGAIKATDL